MNWKQGVALLMWVGAAYGLLTSVAESQPGYLLATGGLAWLGLKFWTEGKADPRA